MIQCDYVYCRRPMKESESICSFCGSKKQNNEQENYLTLNKKLREWLPKKLIDIHQIVRNVPEAVEKQLQAMELLNIEAALLQAGPLEKGSIMGNSALIQFFHNQKLPKTFYLSQFLDPRMPEVVKKLETFKEMGIKVIKLIPNAGYYPDEEQFDFFWEKMSELGQRVMVHTGFITARHKREEKKFGIFLHSKYSNPLYWDIVARKFPELTILLCHSGGGLWYEEAAQMINQHDNVFGDLSGTGLLSLERFFVNRIHVNYNKLMWGNDSSVSCYEHNLNILMHLLEAYHQSNLAEELLYKNAEVFCKEYLS